MWHNVRHSCDNPYSCDGLAVLLGQSQGQQDKELVSGHVHIGSEIGWEQQSQWHYDVVAQELWQTLEGTGLIANVFSTTSYNIGYRHNNRHDDSIRSIDSAADFTGVNVTATVNNPLVLIAYGFTLKLAGSTRSMKAWSSLKLSRATSRLSILSAASKTLVMMVRPCFLTAGAPGLKFFQWEK